MRTGTIIMMAALTLALGSSVLGGEKRKPGQEPETHRSLPASGSWPQQWGERKLHRGELALVYAREKATADKALKVLRTVVEEVRQDGVTKPATGLIVVLDVKETFPLEIAKLTEILNDPNTRGQQERAKEILNGIEGAKTLSKEAGTDLNLLVSVMPIPLGATALQKIVPELPEGLDRDIGWCLIVPTDRCVRAGLRATMDAVVKAGQLKWKERLLIGAAMPLALHEGEKRIRKTWQADLYQFLVDGQNDWAQEIRQQKVRSYRQKLGLDSESSKGGPGTGRGKPEGKSGSG
jgi:hypothetical protein